MKKGKVFVFSFIILFLLLFSVASVFAADCGDMVCESPPENGDNCVVDCSDLTDLCGNGICGDNSGEDCRTCPSDCSSCVSCGDGVCNYGETCSSCASDCGDCPVCGDGTCDSDETCSSCQSDCDVCEVETCDDGIQNQGETGIDCGGPCVSCYVEPSCNDGIQNRDETAVDCGGNYCSPCEEEKCEMGLSDSKIYLDPKYVSEYNLNAFESQFDLSDFSLDSNRITPFDDIISEVSLTVKRVDSDNSCNNPEIKGEIKILDPSKLETYFSGNSQELLKDENNWIVIAERTFEYSKTPITSEQSTSEASPSLPYNLNINPSLMNDVSTDTYKMNLQATKSQSGTWVSDQTKLDLFLQAQEKILEHHKKTRTLFTLPTKVYAYVENKPEINSSSKFLLEGQRILRCANGECLFEDPYSGSKNTYVGLYGEQGIWDAIFEVTALVAPIVDLEGQAIAFCFAKGFRWIKETTTCLLSDAKWFFWSPPKQYKFLKDLQAGQRVALEAGEKPSVMKLMITKNTQVTGREAHLQSAMITGGEGDKVTASIAYGLHDFHSHKASPLPSGPITKDTVERIKKFMEEKGISNLNLKDPVSFILPNGQKVLINPGKYHLTDTASLIKSGFKHDDILVAMNRNQISSEIGGVTVGGLDVAILRYHGGKITSQDYLDAVNFPQYSRLYEYGYGMKDSFNIPMMEKLYGKGWEAMLIKRGIIKPI